MDRDRSERRGRQSAERARREEGAAGSRRGRRQDRGRRFRAGLDGPVPADLESALYKLRNAFGDAPGLVTRRFSLGPRGNIEAALAYLDGLADKNVINMHVLKSIMIDSGTEQGGVSPVRLRPSEAVKLVLERLLSAAEAESTEEWQKVLDGITAGNTVLLFDGSSRAIVVSTPGWPQRSVHEPPSETVVRGPRDGFTETLRVSESLIRRRIKDARLRFEEFEIGRLSKTKVSVGYVAGIADQGIVDEVCARLRRIDVDAVLESGSLEEFIQDDTWSIFPQVLRTERPDTVAAGLLEGRVAILTDNTPFVLIVPATFSMFLSSAEDYYERFPIGTLIRLLRYVSFVIALVLPALYISITTFHQELLPTDLILAISSARQGVPFPALVEALLLETLFEVLREAGVRLPRVIGQAVSIVGALVVGEAAVSAGLVSPAMVIVVAMTAIASFATPVFSFAISARILRFVFMLAASTAGLFGIQIVALLLLVHLASLRSFGIPYLSPVAPVTGSDLDDVVTRVPIWMNDTRPRSIDALDTIRQAGGLKPGPPRESGSRQGTGRRSGSSGERRAQRNGRNDGEGDQP